jgi:hypothetical protein
LEGLYQLPVVANQTDPKRLVLICWESGPNGFGEQLVTGYTYTLENVKKLSLVLWPGNAVSASRSEMLKSPTLVYTSPHRPARSVAVVKEV